MGGGGLTTMHHPENVINNALQRTQVESILKQQNIGLTDQNMIMRIMV